MKKSFTSMLLLLCLATPFAATFLCLQVRRNQIHDAVRLLMMQGHHRDDLVLLSFSTESAASRLEWEHSGEFEFQGRMYDVVESATRGDSVFYWCLADEDETLLNAQSENLATIALGMHPQSQENQSRLVHFCKTLFHAPPRPWQAEPLCMAVDVSRFFFLSSQFDAAPPGPPPRRA